MRTRRTAGTIAALTIAAVMALIPTAAHANFDSGAANCEIFQNLRVKSVSKIFYAATLEGEFRTYNWGTSVWKTFYPTATGKGGSVWGLFGEPVDADKSYGYCI